MKYNLEVEIKNIEVCEYYYSFKYKVFLDGKVKWKGDYENDWGNGMTIKEFKELLEDGEALKIVFEELN